MLVAGVAAVAAIALPGRAHATTVHSDTGWVQLQASASDSASTTIAGHEFAIGYAANFTVEGYNWDFAPNTVSVSCVSMTIDIGFGTITLPLTTCPVLPGTKLSQTTVHTDTTYGGRPAVRNTTTVVWDVPDSGTMAKLGGSFQVPATLFDQDFDVLKLTGNAVGDSNGADSIRGTVSVLGSQVAQGSLALPASGRIIRKCLTLFDVDASFKIWVIPVTVTATSTGCLEVTASASFNGNTLQGVLTPDASVDATASAAIGADIVIASAEAGVEGSITVVDARLPVLQKAFEGRASQLTWNFLRVLNVKGRLSLLRKIADVYDDLF